MKNTYQVQFYTDPETGEEWEKLYSESSETAKGRFFKLLIQQYKKIKKSENR